MIFGYQDIRVYEDCDQRDDNYANIGYCTEAPNDYGYNSNEANCYMAGSNTFKVTEVEVYKCLY